MYLQFIFLTGLLDYKCQIITVYGLDYGHGRVFLNINTPYLKKIRK